MNTIEKIRNVLGLPKTTLYAEMKIDDGRVLVTEAEAFEPGVEVRVLDDSGSTVEVDAGTYTMEDGKKIVVTEDSRMDSFETDEEVEVEMYDDDEDKMGEHKEDEEEMDKHEDEEEMDKHEDEDKHEMNYEKVRDALNQGFPDLGEATIDAIATLVASIYNDEPEIEIEASATINEELADVFAEAFESINKRLEKLEDKPASKGVSVSPNNFSKHEGKDTNKMTGVERALHIIQNSHR